MRHDRRAARLARDKIVRLELIDHHSLLRLIGWQPAFAEGVGAALRAMGTDWPPLTMWLCGRLR